MTSIQLKKELSNIKKARERLLRDRRKARAFLRAIGLIDSNGKPVAPLKRK